jgi:hypothetical protein
LFPHVAEQHLIAQSPQLRKMVVYRRSCFCHTLSFTPIGFAMSLIMDIAHPWDEMAWVSDTTRALGYLT